MNGNRNRYKSNRVLRPHWKPSFYSRLSKREPIAVKNRRFTINRLKLYICTAWFAKKNYLPLHICFRIFSGYNAQEHRIKIRPEHNKTIFKSEYFHLNSHFIADFPDFHPLSSLVLSFSLWRPLSFSHYRILFDYFLSLFLLLDFAFSFSLSPDCLFAKIVHSACETRTGYLLESIIPYLYVQSCNAQSTRSL